MDGCSFQLMGGWKLSIGGEDCTGSVPGGRARLLLAYLALAYGEHPGRRQIAFAFWPDSSEKQALSNLRKHPTTLAVSGPCPNMSFRRII
ncbi:hypothetical protein [Cohnella yongneupensis]|uniref:Uncharacterized protein n=1 Tax=Cohnella yongneupensis TaxID=425006 RepID=A0ABW0QSX8_9BACL